MNADTYDSNGNTLTSAGVTYGYDFEDRMTSAGAVKMLYDGDGHRVSRTSGGVTTKFLVDDLTPAGYAQVAEEELVGGALAVRYTHGIQRISQSRADVTHFYGYDGGGSVRQLTDASGAVTDTYTYDAFGVMIGGTGSTANAYRYRGEQWDASVGMYYLRERWYEPGSGRIWTLDKWEGCGQDGRFLAGGDDKARDSVPCMWDRSVEILLKRNLLSCTNAFRVQSKPPDSGTLHKYLYGDGDPVNSIDPMGQFRLMEWAMNVVYEVRFRIRVTDLGSDTICSVMYASDMLVCCRMLTPMSLDCAARATRRYQLCMGL